MRESERERILKPGMRESEREREGERILKPGMRE
jgi:hypothetical protein